MRRFAVVLGFVRLARHDSVERGSSIVTRRTTTYLSDTHTTAILHGSSAVSRVGKKMIVLQNYNKYNDVKLASITI